MRIPPLRVPPLFRARPIETRKVRPRRRLDTRRLRQSRQKLLIRLAGIAAHDAPQSGVGLQGRRIDPDRLACDEIRRGQHWQDPREDRAVCLQVDQAARPRNRRVLGRHLVQAQAQEAAQRERIGRAPRNPSLRIDAREIPDEPQPEVGPWHHTRASHRRGIERRTLRFDEVVEAVRVEEVIQTLVKRVTARGGQLIRGNPTTQASVPNLCVDSWPCQSVVRGIDRVDPLRSFNHGLLGRRGPFWSSVSGTLVIAPEPVSGIDSDAQADSRPNRVKSGR